MLNGTNITWNVARDECFLEGGDLASIKSSEELEFVSGKNALKNLTKACQEILIEYSGRTYLLPALEDIGEGGILFHFMCVKNRTDI